MAANPEIAGLPSPSCCQAPKVVLLDLDLTPDPGPRTPDPMPAVYTEARMMQLWAVDQAGDESRPQRPEADVTL
ncbi:hypothetical protein EYF80_059520 [Liparis tanakae]|uniref:Uncharacterized protein n=1 Tax=Liparis tanakae TaxID=230148 RepID=A0A4Z2EN12_9TELE|nr:hypothetical protein EYF80_059520 [Liparis tanakae]